jgi:hypothetical protein
MGNMEAVRKTYYLDFNKLREKFPTSLLIWNNSKDTTQTQSQLVYRRCTTDVLYECYGSWRPIVTTIIGCECCDKCFLKLTVLVAGVVIRYIIMHSILVLS